jgi:hypothetical protein
MTTEELFGQHGHQTRIRDRETAWVLNIVNSQSFTKSHSTATSSRWPSGQQRAFQAIAGLPGSS